MRMLALKTAGVALVTAAIAVGDAATARADDTIMADMKVPFAFIVGDARLPAGEYAVREVSDGAGLLEIVSVDGQHVALTLTVPYTPDNAWRQTTNLVFEKFGHEYFLSRVEPADGNDREIILTPAIAEREVARADRANN
jgi:hypothetical protein